MERVAKLLSVSDVSASGRVRVTFVFTSGERLNVVITKSDLVYLQGMAEAKLAKARRRKQT